MRGNLIISQEVTIANEEIRRLRPDVTIAFADYDSRFDGHRVCDAEPYINGLQVVSTNTIGNKSIFEQTSFHPNKQGQAVMADVVEATVEQAEHPQMLVGGQTAQLIGQDFQPGEHVSATLHSAVVRLGTFSASRDGQVDVTAHLPASLSPGRHLVLLTGSTSHHIESINVIVAGGKSRPSSASDARLIAGVGISTLALLGVSAVAVTARRKRRRRRIW